MDHRATFDIDKTFKINANERSCGDCTHCCEGHLTCNIFGFEVGPGSPCKFVIPGKGCSTYEYRPHNPCKTFKCLWKIDDRVPERFKPNQIKNILIPRKIDDISFMDIVEAGSPIDIEVLDWALRMFNEGKIDNIRYFYKGRINYVTRNPEWVDKMEAYYLRNKVKN